MAVQDGQNVNAAVTNAALMSRTVNTSTVGRVDINNTTDSTAPTNGALHTTGGAGIEKSLFVGQSVDVGANAVIQGTLDVTGPTNASSITATGTIQGNDITATDILTGNSLVVTTSASIGTTLTVTGDTTLNGNLLVTGTTTTVNSTTVSTVDKNITISQGGNDAASEGAGLTVDRTSTDGSLIYKDASASKWAAGPLGAEIDLVNVSGSQTLTNKSIDGTTNTITNLQTSSLPVVPISKGGTGQTGQTAAYNALSPNTTKGDIAVHNGTNNVRQAVGADGFVLVADSAESTGVKWAASTAGANTALSNLATTSINQDLLPSADNVRKIGSAALTWAEGFIRKLSNASGNQIDLDLKYLLFNGTAVMAWFSGGIQILTNKVLRFTDGAGSNTITIQAPATSTSHSLTLPNALAATSGHVLESTAAGVLKWAGATGFMMSKTGGDNNGNSGVINYTSTIFDTASGVNLAAGTYTIQEAGSYYFEAKNEWASAQAVPWLIVVDGGSSYPYGYSNASSSYNATSAYFNNLTVGQVAKVISGTGSTISMNSFTFSGFKVK